MPSYKEIELSQIHPNPYQPRTIFIEEGIDELAQSIKENGLIQPITVRQDDSGYELIAGERRYRACQQLQLKTIGAFIIEANEIESATLAMIENIQRQDLSAIEEANGYLQMLRITGTNQTQLAQRVGKKQSTIANKLRLLNLDQQVQQAITNQQISERHGRALLNLTPSQQKEVLDVILKKDLTVKKTEEYVLAHYEAEPKRKGSKRCFGVMTRLIINSFKDTFNKAKQLSKDVTMKEQETEDSYIMTITIKK